MSLGTILALISAAIATVFAGIGSIRGVGMSAEAGMGVLAEDPSKFGKLLVLELLPGTQGLYGFIVSFLILMNIGIFGGINANIASEVGWLYIVASLPIAIGGLISGIAQGRVAAASVNIVAKNPNDWSKGMVLCIIVEFYAILSLLISFLMIMFGF